MKEIKSKDVKKFLVNNIVPIIFIVLCAACIPVAGYSGQYLVDQIITRIVRNSFLVLSLLIPIMAGMGLNFGMTLGAMAGQIGLIFITAWNIVSIPGLLLAAIIATPIAILLGWFCGKMLNMAKGREMITSYMISFFMNGVYQLVVLYGMGSVIPIHANQVILPRGYGARNTIDLLNVRKSIRQLLVDKALHGRERHGRHNDPSSHPHPHRNPLRHHHLVQEDEDRTGHESGRTGHGGRKRGRNQG